MFAGINMFLARFKSHFSLSVARVIVCYVFKGCLYVYTCTVYSKESKLPQKSSSEVKLTSELLFWGYVVLTLLNLQCEPG